MQFAPQIMDIPIELALDDEKSAPASQTTMEVTETSIKILGIIFEYALNKFNNTKEQLAAGTPKFLSAIDQFVVVGTQVQMCLPAFPFKSANKVDKVFGILPDKAEQLALERLHTMCLRIGDVYPPGAKLTVISDGLVYNGLSNTRLAIALAVSHLLRWSFFVNRFVGYTGSRHLGLWGGSTQNGGPEGVSSYRLLQT